MALSPEVSSLYNRIINDPQAVRERGGADTRIRLTANGVNMTILDLRVTKESDRKGYLHLFVPRRYLRRAQEAGVVIGLDGNPVTPEDRTVVRRINRLAVRALAGLPKK